MGLSIRAYARHRGVSDTAIRKAIKAGRITPEADGTIDPQRADAQWSQNTLDVAPGTKAGTASTSQADELPMPQAPRAARAPTAPSGPNGGTTLLQARTANEIVKAQANKVRLARLKGELVDRQQAIAHVFALARAERDAWINWPPRIAPQLAARLAVDPHAMHVALDAVVREHLQELAEIQPRLD